VPRTNELMHWTAIAWAHHAGYRYYDFEGISVEVAQALRDGRPAQPRGVAFFKLGFGGVPVVYPGTYDLLPDGLAGRALRQVLPRLERWQSVVHRMSGRPTARRAAAGWRAPLVHAHLRHARNVLAP
jgi:lipid II:glycine glycyltransferase (peptidoglycan interpeptide bridge formation enzyme)